MVGKRVLTALDGLPDTRVERVAFEGTKILVSTRKGAVYVSWPDLRVLKEPVRNVASAQHADGPLAFQGSAMIRSQHTTDRGICFATDQGLRVAPRLSANSFGPAERYGPSGGMIPSANVAALADGDDTLFVGTFDAGLFRRTGKDGALVPIDTKNPNINALLWDRARKVLWVATARGLVRCDHGVNCTRVGEAVGVHAVAALDGGAVVAGGEGSLAFFAADGTRRASLLRKHGLPFRAVWALARDAGGLLYVGTTSGVYIAPTASFMTEAADKVAFQRLSMARGELPDDWVTALAVQGSSIHVGTYNAGLVSFKREADVLKRDAAHPSLGYVNPAGISVLPNGELAISTMSGLKVGRASETGVFRHVATLGDDVTAVLPTRSGTSWVATRRGVMSSSAL